MYMDLEVILLFYIPSTKHSYKEFLQPSTILSSKYNIVSQLLQQLINNPFGHRLHIFIHGGASRAFIPTTLVLSYRNQIILPLKIITINGM
jgi:hypothetical protein